MIASVMNALLCCARGVGLGLEDILLHPFRVRDYLSRHYDEVLHSYSGQYQDNCDDWVDQLSEKERCEVLNVCRQADLYDGSGSRSGSGSGSESRRFTRPSVVGWHLVCRDTVVVGVQLACKKSSSSQSHFQTLSFGSFRGIHYPISPKLPWCISGLSVLMLYALNPTLLQLPESLFLPGLPKPTVPCVWSKYVYSVNYRYSIGYPALMALMLGSKENIHRNIAHFAVIFASYLLGMYKCICSRGMQCLSITMPMFIMRIYL